MYTLYWQLFFLQQNELLVCWRQRVQDIVVMSFQAVGTTLYYTVVVVVVCVISATSIQVQQHSLSTELFSASELAVRCWWVDLRMMTKFCTRRSVILTTGMTLEMNLGQLCLATSKLWERERERDFYSHKAGNQKGHAHQTWCLLFSNISMI